MRRFRMLENILSIVIVTKQVGRECRLEVLGNRKPGSVSEPRKYQRKARLRTFVVSASPSLHCGGGAGPGVGTAGGELQRGA